MSKTAEAGFNIQPGGNWDFMRHMCKSVGPVPDFVNNDLHTSAIFSKDEMKYYN